MAGTSHIKYDFRNVAYNEDKKSTQDCFLELPDDVEPVDMVLPESEQDRYCFAFPGSFSIYDTSSYSYKEHEEGGQG